MALLRVEDPRSGARLCEAQQAATRQIEDCFGRLDQITNGKLDKLMAQFETSQPAFFEEYWAARKIGQVGSRSSKSKQGVVPLSKAA